MTRITFSAEVSRNQESSSDGSDSGLSPEEQARGYRPTRVETQTVRDQILIVSNPPQRDIDLPLAAPAFGLTPAEVRMKANYGVPEIWLADRDPDQIDTTVQTMRLAGLRVTVIPGEELVLPAQSVVNAFSFERGGLAVRTGESELELPYDTRFIAVHCQPRRDTGSGRVASDGLTDGLVARRGHAFMTRDSLVGFGGLGRRSSSAGQSAGDERQPAFLDLYFEREGQIVRITVHEQQTDFAGLMSLASSDCRKNIGTLAGELEKRFPNARVDRRLVDMVPRTRPMVGKKTQYDAVRRGYSFATEALSQLLAAISPGLEHLSQFEFSSRLAYLATHYAADE